MILEILALVSIIAVGTLVLYIDYLTESSLRSKIQSEIPDTLYADVENITHQYGAEYGITYHIKARKKNGSSEEIEVKCKKGNLNKYSRIRI